MATISTSPGSAVVVVLTNSVFTKVVVVESTGCVLIGGVVVEESPEIPDTIASVVVVV